MNLPKRDYRKTGFGGQHKGICRYNSEVLMMLLTKEKGVPQALANPLKSQNKSKKRSKMIRDDLSVCIGDIRVSF